MGRHSIVESKKRKTFNFTISGETYHNVIPTLSDICKREGISIADLTESFWKVYVSEHGDGNPNYQLDQFVDPNFLATPALMREPKIIKEYLNAIKGTPLWDNVINQINAWVTKANEVEDDS